VHLKATRRIKQLHGLFDLSGGPCRRAGLYKRTVRRVRYRSADRANIEQREGRFFPRKGAFDV